MALINPDSPLDGCRVTLKRIDQLTIEGEGGFARGREIARYLESLDMGYRTLGLACAADGPSGPGWFTLRVEREANYD